MRKRLTILTALAGVTCALLASLIIARRTSPPSAQATALPALTSYIAVMNPGTGAAIVTVAYVGAEGACAGKTYPHAAGQQTVAAGGVALFDQEPGTTSGLPKGCNASAVVTALRGPVLAVVVDGAEDGRGNQLMLSAYRAIGAGEAASTADVPAWQLASGTSERTTLVQAMNIGGSADVVTLALQGAKGQPLQCSRADCQTTLAAHEAAAWWPPELKSLAGSDSVVGTALVTAKQPLAVVAASYALAGSADSTAANAVPQRVQGNGGNVQIFPLAFNDEKGAFAPGTGNSALRLHSLATNAALDVAARAFHFAGGDAIALAVPAIDPDLAAWLPLADQPALKVGSYALRLTGEQRYDAMVRSDWGGAMADSTESLAELNLVVPFVAKKFRNLDSKVLVHNLDEKSGVAVILRLNAATGGASQPKTLDVPAGGTAVVDIAADFPNFPDGSFGSLQLIGRGEIAVAGILVSAKGTEVAAVFEGAPASAAAAELFAPMVHAEWALSRNQPSATDTPTAAPTEPPSVTPTATQRSQATDTPTAAVSPTPTQVTPSPAPSDTPTAGRTVTPRPSRATPNAKNGWRWPVTPDRLAGLDEKPRCVSRAKDGTLWLRIAPPERGPDRVIVVNEAGGTVDVYRNLAEAVVARLDQVRRLGKLHCFFVVDRMGRVWVGAHFYNGQAWVDAGRDELQDAGELRFEERVLLDRNDHAWVPWRGERECLLGTDCRTFGLRLVNEDGTAGGGLMVEPPPEAGRYGIAPLELIEDEPPTTNLNLTGQAELRSGNASAPLRAWQAEVAATDFAVLARSVVKLPDRSTFALPNLADPALGSKAIGNAGYATTSLRDPASGELWVITWVELHQGSGASRSIAYKVYLNRWNGTTWKVEDLSAGPIFADDPAIPNDGLVVDRVTAAGVTSGGTLWIGTASGRVASRKNALWDALFKPTDTDSPLSGEPITAITVDESGATPDVCFLSTSLVLCQAEGESDLNAPTIYAPRTVKGVR